MPNWTIENFVENVGRDCGTSDWMTITQDMIDSFGNATLDPDPMHMDPAWARKHGIGGSTIAYGFLTTSLLSHMLQNAMGKIEDAMPRAGGWPVNYGFDRLRLVAPVPVNSRIRCFFTLLEVREHKPDVQVIKLGARVEIEGNDKPALVAEWLCAWAATD